MKAVTCTNAKLDVVDQPTPTPAKGQLLLDVVGHEFCGEVLDRGPGTRKAPRAGTPVVALPLLRHPLFSRVVVVGVCMGADQLRPSMAINKEIDLRFVLGYTPLEFRDTLHMLADGKVDATSLITGTVGLPGVAAAFDALGDPEAHAKILIDPKSDTTSPS